MNRFQTPESPAATAVTAAAVSTLLSDLDAISRIEAALTRGARPCRLDRTPAPIRLADWLASRR